MRIKRYMLAVCLMTGLGLAWSSCDTSPQTDAAITETDEDSINLTEESKAQADQVKHIFRAVPSPMEMASVLKRVGAQYDASLLNDVKNVNGYNTSRSQALNLGIYGAGLSYASVFNQNQESIIYLSCAKKLADKLGVSKAFDDETIERIEANVDNRDSLLNIVSETYYMLDAYLKENDRDHISAMVITAGWIEGLYISSTLAVRKEDASDVLVERIADQKVSLKNLIELVEAYNREGMIDELAEDLAILHAIFDDEVVMSAETDTPSNGAAVIGKASKAEISMEGLARINEAVTEIRTRYIS